MPTRSEHQNSWFILGLLVLQLLSIVRTCYGSRLLPLLFLRNKDFLRMFRLEATFWLRIGCVRVLRVLRILWIIRILTSNSRVKCNRRVLHTFFFLSFLKGVLIHHCTHLFLPASSHGAFQVRSIIYFFLSWILSLFFYLLNQYMLFIREDLFSISFPFYLFIYLTLSFYFFIH